MELLAFLEARIAEDEARAVEAQGWVAHGPTPHIPWYGAQGDRAGRVLAGGYSLVSAMSPTRILAECAAKRAIIADYQLTVTRGTLLHLASVYKGHPDFNSDWI